jgi:hypothetical protein
MEEANNPLNIVILDACRDNPFPRKNRSASRGLARMDSASGTIIAYSTGPGNVAADGEGRNSPYTSHLLKYMGSPGLTIEQVFKKVRVGVEDSTASKQLPWETSSLRGDFYFVPQLQQANQKQEPSLPQKTDNTHIKSNEQIFTPTTPQKGLGSSAVDARALTIFTNPQESKVSILNSTILYSMGVKLVPGDYRIEVSKEGYRSKKRWISIDKNNVEIQITLVPEY